MHVGLLAGLVFWLARRLKLRDWLATLGVGVALFVIGLAATTSKSIGAPAYPGLLLVMIGLVIAGPWLTAAAARWCARVLNGASPLLAARRLADNPKAAFRAVRGLVLAVFLGTMVGALVPAVESISATPNAAALSHVLLDTFSLPGPNGFGPGLAPRPGAKSTVTEVVEERHEMRSAPADREAFGEVFKEGAGASQLGPFRPKRRRLKTR